MISVWIRNCQFASNVRVTIEHDYFWFFMQELSRGSGSISVGQHRGIITDVLEHVPNPFHEQLKGF